MDNLREGNAYDHNFNADLEDETFKKSYALGSWFYFPNRAQVQDIHDQFVNKEVDFMLDSGVFTFRKKNIYKSTDDYIKFLNANADLIKYAVTMDYPHDGAEIVKNTDYIQARLDPRVTLIPVIQTFIFSKEQIEYTLQNYTHICMGTYDGVHKSIMYNKEVQQSLEQVYELNKIYKRRLHGLGRTRTDWLKDNPVWSSDSSGWARYLFTGNTVFWDEKEMKNVSYSKEHRFKCLKHEEYYYQRFGIDKHEFYKLVSSVNNLHTEFYPHSVLCALTYILQQEEIRKKNPNNRIFLATSNAKNFNHLNNALDLYYNRNKDFDNKIIRTHPNGTVMISEVI